MKKFSLVFDQKNLFRNLKSEKHSNTKKIEIEKYQ